MSEQNNGLWFLIFISTLVTLDYLFDRIGSTKERWIVAGLIVAVSFSNFHFGKATEKSRRR